jgi:hypothetical protein
LLSRIWEKLPDVDLTIAESLSRRAIRGETLIRNLRAIVSAAEENNAPDQRDFEEVLIRVLETLGVLKTSDEGVKEIVNRTIERLHKALTERPTDFTLFDPPSTTQ